MNRGSGATSREGGGIDGSFNEAPIHESGKFPGAWAGGRQHLPASMRPRFMNRGSRVRDIHSRPAGDRLQ